VVIPHSGRAAEKGGREVTVDELADALDSQIPVLVTDEVEHADIFTLVLPTVDRLAGSVGL
jgi:hypothetical protein